MWLLVDFHVPFCESRYYFQKFIFLMSSRDLRPVLYSLVPRRCTSETKYCVLGISGTWVNVWRKDEHGSRFIVL